MQIFIMIFFVSHYAVVILTTQISHAMLHTLLPKKEIFLSFQFVIGFSSLDIEVFFDCAYIGGGPTVVY